MATKKMFDPKSGNGLIVRIDNSAALDAGIAALLRDEVLIGFPEDTTDRPDDQKEVVTNAALGYIHENGAPEAKIPARPFMVPGMEAVMPQAEKTLSRMAQYALKGDYEKVTEGFERIGIMGVDAMRDVIKAGIAPPLADSTVRARAKRGRKGAQAELNRRAAGYGPSLQLAVPLLDTGEMNKAINYVVRPRALRKR